MLSLTWQYLRYHRAKSVLLVLALALTFFLPIAATLLVRYYERDLTQRADRTPLVLGSRGDRFDLVLKALYFTGESPRPLRYADYQALAAEERGAAIPLYLEYTARGWPLVATIPEYYAFRSLRPTAGTLPLQVGDCTLGAEVAAELGLAPGDVLPSDQANLYDLAAAYPLRMSVVGVLAPTGSPDDRAVFASLETGWVVAGHGHGHELLDGDAAPDKLLSRTEGAVTASAAVTPYIEITPENIAGFHFHGDRAELPLTAVLAVPRGEKEATLLKGKYSVSETGQILAPPEVVADLLGIVFKVKRFFDASFALVLGAAGLFLAIVVLLSLRLRRRERETLFRMGCSRGTIAAMQGLELAIVATLAFALAALAAAALLAVAPSVGPR